MRMFLVTGGAGFIGSHIAETLVERGHKVRVVDNLSTGRLVNLEAFRTRIEFIEGDISDPRLMADAMRSVDYVFHEAALASVAQIHQKKAAPLLPLFLHYETERIVLEFLPPVLASGPERTVQTLTQELTGLIEQQIRKHPEQWFWFHNRWKNRTIGASL